MYVPQKKVVIASSFEGVVNNGAKECGVVSLAAYEQMVKGGRLKNQRSFAKEDQQTVMKAFLALRPLVAVAGDYLTVLMLIRNHMATATAMVNGNGRSEQYKKESVAHFQKEFEIIKDRTKDQRAEFNKEFYAERKARQTADYNGWLALQEPFAETIEQFRQLNELKSFSVDNLIRGQFEGFVSHYQSGGFKLYYVTSKDEASTYQLCTVYGEFGRFKPGEVSDRILTPGDDWASFFESLKTCLIHRDCIVGKETVENVDKLVQMQMVAKKEGVPPAQVWRLQDRFDKDEIETLKAAGFEHQFIVTGGYAFPTDYDQARSHGVAVIERGKMASQLAAYAQAGGF